MVDQSMYLVWVRGGSPFSLSSQANPALEHDGRDSVGHLVLSPTEAAHVKSFIEDQGGKVTLERREGQTKEQEIERMRLLGVGREGTVWPSRLCPQCAWFDPLMDNPCGRESWETSSVEAFGKSPKAIQDWENCDVGGKSERVS